MKCEILHMPGTVVFVCGNSRLRAGPCDTPGCGRPYTKLCDYPVKKKIKGVVVVDKATCDRKLCAGCAHPQPSAQGEPTRDYCRVHHELASKDQVSAGEGNR